MMQPPIDPREHIRGMVANDALLSRPVEQLVPGVGGAPLPVQETLQQAFSWGQSDRERAMGTRPDRLMPGK